MIRILISIIIITLLITYAILPSIKYIQKFFDAEKKRIKKTFEKEDAK